MWNAADIPQIRWLRPVEIQSLQFRIALPFPKMVARTRQAMRGSIESVFSGAAKVRICCPPCRGLNSVALPPVTRCDLGPIDQAGFSEQPALRLATIPELNGCAEEMGGMPLEPVEK